MFVEALDKCFENVCELDLIFHSDRVHYILDEVVMGGMVLETNMQTILQSVRDQGKPSAFLRFSACTLYANAVRGSILQVNCTRIR